MTTVAQRKQRRLHKLDPKAFLGYLVRYQSTNIYKIWIPLLNKVISTRDVIFNEDEVFPGTVEQLKDDFLHITTEEIAALIEKVKEPELQPQTREQESDNPIPPSYETDKAYPAEREGEAQKEPVQKEPDNQVKAGAKESPETFYPTPRDSPAAALFANNITIVEGLGRLFLEEEKERSFRQKTSPWATAFIAGALISRVKDDSKEMITKAQRQRNERDPSKTKIHRSDLPEPPKHRKHLHSHPLYNLFLQAEKDHLQSHDEMGSWEEIDDREAQGHQILDYMWVYTYKLDKDGILIKCKARLVVRGDQQLKGEEDTYASTLAARSFRLLMATSARFDLELKQYDAVNAFVNTSLKKVVYMRMPPGYRKRGKLVRVLKALYGLPVSPSLWQEDLQGTLTELGLKVIPKEPCCIMREGIIVFFYVDDIVLAYRKKYEQQVTDLMTQVKARYQITGGNDLQWFLGIEVIRDRERKLIWLSQSEYSRKIANLITHLDPNTKASTPMRREELFPFEGIATGASITIYQRKVRSILYVAVVTRPDVAFAISRLARFNQNPGPEHHEAADRVLIYLKTTHDLSLEYGGGNDLETASDSSFGDNTLDRRSSQAHTIKLFGGLIGWRANKQPTVTTSTTEAELLALAQAAKEALFVSRLL